MKKRLWFVLLLVLLLAGCGAAKNTVMPEQGMGEGGYDYDTPQSGVVSPAEPIYDENRSDGLAGTEQRLIYTAGLDLETEDLEQATAEVTRITRQAGGFVASSYLYGTEKRRTAEFKLRIPAARLNEVLAEIRLLGNVKRDTLDSDDVTLQYVDLEARIRNLQRQEERLLEILAQAETVEDILRVEQELSRVRGDLEAHTAEFRYLRDRVDFATVSVSMAETYAASTTVSAGGLKGVWQRGINGLILSVNSLLTGLGEFVVFIFRALPYLLLLFLIAIIVCLLKRKLISRKDS
ncbi:MAG: DUF4349 domain-containing protein [Firmicutes bacterium]|nr:DUF4349 domain-containing protein [Bacillota bacterium]